MMNKNNEFACIDTLSIRVYERNDEVEYLNDDGKSNFFLRSEDVKKITWDTVALFSKLTKEWSLVTDEEIDFPLEFYMELERKYQTMYK